MSATLLRSSPGTPQQTGPETGPEAPGIVPAIWGF